MVQPIRPVGCFPASCRGTFAFCHPALIRRAGVGTGWAVPCRPNLAAILLGKAMGLDQFRGLLGVKCVTAESLSHLRPVADHCAEQITSVEPWKPWPAHPPFIDEVQRWWPSQDWPPPDPPIIIKEAIPDGPPYLIIWAPPGRLIDLWA